jgi:hypothetical protein
VYLTVRACRSVGAPERTAAATESPGSLPFMTLFGTGEKVLLFINGCTLAGCRNEHTMTDSPPPHRSLADVLLDPRLAPPV